MTTAREHLNAFVEYGSLVRLEDLQDLKRPGDDGLGDELWQAFASDPRVEMLRWPEPVIRQFLFDHGRNDEFVTQYGDIELQSVGWDLLALRASEFRTVSVFEGFRDWFDSSATQCEYRLSMRPRDQQLHWEQTGTWIIPPVLIDGSLMEPPEAGLHVVEGHTRIGILLGRLALGCADPNQTHDAYVGHLGVARGPAV